MCRVLTDNRPVRILECAADTTATNHTMVSALTVGVLGYGSIGTLRNVHAYAKSKGDKGSTPAGNCPSRLANQKQFITRSHTSTVFFLFLRFRFPQKYQNMLLALGVGAE